MHPEMIRALAQARIDGMLADANAYRIARDGRRSPGPRELMTQLAAMRPSRTRRTRLAAAARASAPSATVGSPCR